MSVYQPTGMFVLIMTGAVAIYDKGDVYNWTFVCKTALCVDHIWIINVTSIPCTLHT